MVRRAIVGGMAAAGTWLVLGGGAAALGQGDDIFSGQGGAFPGQTPTGGGMPVLPLQILGFLLLSAASFMLAFYVLFPLLLRKRHPSWPKEAYGAAWSCVLVAMSLAFLAIFWNDLVLTRFFPGARSVVNDVVNHYSLKAAVGLVTLIGLIATSTRHRSELRAAARAEGAAR